MTFRGLGIWDLARDYWVRVRDLGSSWGAFPRRAVKQWVEEERAQTSARVEHGRSGDPGLGVRNKEQWADRRVMTATPTCADSVLCLDPVVSGRMPSRNRGRSARGCDDGTPVPQRFELTITIP
jgi:hypothetical protein